MSVAQAGMNAAALLATVMGPLTIGALTKRNAHTGWRNFYVGLSEAIFTCTAQS